MTGSGSGSLPPPYATDPFFSPMIKEMVFLMKFLAETLSNGLPAHATRCLLGCSFCLRRSTFLSFLKGRRIRRSAFTLPPPHPHPTLTKRRGTKSFFRIPSIFYLSRHRLVSDDCLAAVVGVVAVDRRTTSVAARASCLC